MTITELKYIVALAKEQHFGRAADSVYVSQPTLSIGIKKLEDELGITIFERLSNMVIPTQIGLQIIEAAQNTLMSADTIKSIAQSAKGELMGKIKIGAIYTICPYLLPKLVPELQQSAPDLQVFIEENYTHQLISKLKNGSLDLAILSLPVPDSNLFETKVLFEEDFVVISSATHPFSKKESVSSKDLDDQDVFLLGGGNCFRDQVLQACPQCLPPKIKEEQNLEGGSLETIRLMVSGNLGVSIFPRMALMSESDVIIREFSEPKPKRKIALCWRKSFTQLEVIKKIEESVIAIRQ